MKVWIKILLGIIAGIITGIAIPPSSPAAIPTLNFLSDLSINIGRYIFFPMIFFSLTLMVFELNRNKMLFKTILHTSWLMILTAFIFAAIGTISALALNPGVIPILTEEIPVIVPPTIAEILLQTFPRNLFKIFSTDGNFLFPIIVFAFFFGWNLSFDKITTRPSVDLVDSLARTFYHMNNFIVEIAGFLLFFCSTYFVVTLKSKADIKLFTDYLLFLTLISAILIFVIYPLAIYLTTKNKRPYKFLFGIMSPAMAGFITGDIYFSLALQIRHNEKNLGINERINTLTTSFLAVLGRSGTALVTGSSFILVHKAYSSLPLTFSEVLFVIILSFAISFVSGTVPGAGTIISLSIIAAIFKKSTTDSHLLINQVAPLMLAFSAMLDTINAAFISLLTDYLTNKKSYEQKQKIPISKFI
ncbi:MAG: dicarboxylate/amino acid:cation symporter [Spirochaetales bacterium]|nr:dicarboxylate/amino acid:cation symporter [Spirochaetales bacterium]